ncbi:MAG: hypothetical protein IJC93_07165 [Clostridia bacterium]|nr:hypothetical protein [Clostridia bacterium]
MKKLLCMLLILATFAALFAGCGVSKTPENGEKTTKATTKATSDTDEADVNPGAVTTVATTESLLGKTLEAPEVLAHYADYDEFTITARITEIVPNTPETAHLIGLFAYRKADDGSESYYYALKSDSENLAEENFVIEHIACKDGNGERMWIRPSGDTNLYPVDKTDDPLAFDGIEDFRGIIAYYGIDYAEGFAGEAFVKGEDTMIDGRPCYTYEANLRRTVGQPWDCMVEIAVDKSTGLWLKMEGSYTLEGYDGEGYLLEEILTFEENADIIPEIPEF